MEKHIRTFIAIPISNELKNIILDVQNKLKTFDAKVNWIQPLNIHLTLVFTGYLSEKQIEICKKVLEETVQTFNEFSMEISKLETFKKKKVPKIIFLGIKNPENLLNLHKEITESLKAHKFKVEKRIFTPHITIGRVKTENKGNLLLKAIEDIHEINSHAEDIKQVNFMQSILTPHGAKYSIIHNVYLKKYFTK